VLASGDNRNADRSDSDFESGSDLLKTNNDSSAIEVFTIAADKSGSSLDSISQFIVENFDLPLFFTVFVPPRVVL